MSKEQGPRVSDEAAMWFARMLRSDAASFDEAFESWRGADRAHGEAYERVRRQYDRSAVLAHSSAVPESRHRRVWRRSFLPIGVGVGAIAGGFAAAAVMLLGFSAAFTSLMEPGTRSGSPSTIADARRASGSPYEVGSPLGDIRSVVLPDGSKVTLDTGAVLVVAYDERNRFVRLAKGRARFEVVHELRPFVVAAGGWRRDRAWHHLRRRGFGAWQDSCRSPPGRHSRSCPECANKWPGVARSDGASDSRF